MSDPGAKHSHGLGYGWLLQRRAAAFGGFVQDRHLVEKGLTNYWGYNPVSYFALDPSRDPELDANMTPAATPTR